ncbi:MAG: hypothetical protein ACYS0I_11190 [Planctomycetota bacterium]
MFIYVFHIGSALLILLGCCFIFSRKGRHSFWAYFLLGWSLQIVLSLPAGIWQAFFSWPHISTSAPLWNRIFFVPLLGWFFNAGGYTVRYVFEATVVPLEWLVGHRSMTVLSNMPYYLFLMAVQVSILALIFALRYKSRKTFRDWVPICLGILFLINSFANVKWFWAGT